jgi:hypothetical protein
MEKKPKSKIVGTNSISPRREISLFPVSEGGNLPNETKNKVFWETLRKRPGYLELCKGIKFYDRTGLPSMWHLKPENQEDYFKTMNRARELFSIEELVDPRKEYSELQPDIVNLFGIAPKLVSAIAPAEAPPGPRQFIEDDRYVTLRIDISERYDYIEPLIKVHLDHFRGQVKQKAGREHYEKQLEYLKVWDERKKKVPFKTIASGKKITVEVAKKRFYRAYENIMGKPYDQEFFNKIEIHKTELRKTCINCPDKECLKSIDRGAWVPCPETAHFFNQDVVKLGWRERKERDPKPKKKKLSKVKDDD